MPNPYASTAGAATITSATRAKGVQGGDPTTLIVSQRVSSVRDADLICVMRHGSAVGVGTHEELLSSCDIYREICVSQLGLGEGATSHA